VSAPETQNTPPNPFFSAFDLLLAKLVAAEQALRVSEATFEHASDLPDEWQAEASDGGFPDMIADICDTSNPGYVVYRMSFRWPEREREHLLRDIANFRTQACLWSIACAFEHFREFVEAVEGSLPLRERTCLCHIPSCIAQIVSRSRTAKVRGLEQP